MKIFDNLGIDEDPHTLMSRLSVSKRQMVEIAKAVSYNSKIIVFDEPTSSLTETEAEHLFRIIDLLKKRGAGIIYISHKMEEILKISDDVTVMRDGKYVATEEASETDHGQNNKAYGRARAHKQISSEVKHSRQGNYKCEKSQRRILERKGCFLFSQRGRDSRDRRACRSRKKRTARNDIRHCEKEKRHRDRSRKKGRQPFEPSG